MISIRDIENKEWKTLTEIELKEIKSVVEFELATRSSKQSSTIEFLYINIQQDIFKRLNTLPLPFGIFKKNNGKYFKKLKEVDTFLNKMLLTSFGKESTILEYNKFTYIYALLVGNYIYKYNLPIIPETYINMYHMFPSLFNIEFPDYLRNGVFLKNILSK